jgi:hypothetical protein
MPVGGAIAAGLGLVGNIVGIAKASKGAKVMRKMAKDVPVAERSIYPGLAIGQAQMELNADPLAAAREREAQSIRSQAQVAQKMVTDPTQLLQMASAYSAQAGDQAFKNQLMREQMRAQKMQGLTQAYGMGMQQDQMDFENKAYTFGTKAGLIQGSYQTQANAWQNLGNSLMSAAGPISQMDFKK